MVDPILIMAMPRSGSSMTAGIFAQHGVWVGPHSRDPRRNTKGSFEGKAIRNAVINTFGRGHVGAGMPCGQVPGFRARVEEAIASEGYEGGPWLWKGSAMYWRAWYEFPDAKWVVCRRDEKASIASALAPPYVYGKSCTADEAKRIVRAHTAELDKIVQQFDAPEVDTEAVAHGDFLTIELALKRCGIEPDRSKIEGFIDPTMWHYRGERA